ncbi:MAG: hypothetical protein R2939_22380, partial [Kofleriaceae bacterium]
EAELRELTLTRIGDTSRIVIGRQIVSELAAHRLDGVRVDLIRSEKLTLLGFAGAHPARVSRSIGFDYPRVRDEGGDAVGRLLPITAGAGAAYRVEKAYGAAGLVTVIPGKGEAPRAFLTTNGYLRTSPQLDVYHYGLIDVVGDAGFALTNLSAGADYRPRDRVRLSAALHRVDADTLDILARNFLSTPTTAGAVENGTQVRRIASNQARLGLSVSLGQIEQIEVSTAFAVRQRGEIDLSDDPAVMGDVLPASQAGELWGQVVHRELLGSRIGFDLSRTFGVGGQLYNRSTSLAVRAFVSREFAGGRGEWDAQLGYGTAKDDATGNTCTVASVIDCYGASSSKTLSAVGTVYYLVRPSIFVLGTLDVSSTSGETVASGMTVSDPAVVGLAAYLRLAYRY